jgi:hypothetical protein
MRPTILTVKRGDTWNIQFDWKNDNAPIDLTGCTARMQIRDKLDALITTVTTANHITIFGTTGTVNVSFPSAITEDIDPGTYYSDLEITFPVTGQVQSSNIIQFQVQQDITR